MHNAAFQNANKVLVGVLRENKKQGLDVRKPKSAITKSDLEKVYENFLIPGLEKGDVKILQLKVFFDLVYLMGRRGREGLRKLQKDWFAIKQDEEGNEYVEIVVNEVTKKNQGDVMSARKCMIDDDSNPMFAQPGSDRCPVNSFHHCISLLNPKINDFFQHVNVKKQKFDAAPVGIHTINSWMPLISKEAKLSQRYTNHQIRKTSTTGMWREGRPIPLIAHHLKHKDLQTLQHYLEQPTIEDKRENARALHNYSTSNEADKLPAPSTANNPKNDTHPTATIPDVPPETPMPPIIAPNKENVIPENALIPFESNLGDGDNNASVPTVALLQATSNITNNNQVKQAPVMFGGATFHNCTFNLNVPQ